MFFGDGLRMLYLLITSKCFYCIHIYIYTNKIESNNSSNFSKPFIEIFILQ